MKIKERAEALGGKILGLLPARASELKVEPNSRPVHQSIGIWLYRELGSKARKRLQTEVPAPRTKYRALPEDGIAMFELFVQGDEISVLNERHCQLVPARENVLKILHG